MDRPGYTVVVDAVAHTVVAQMGHSHLSCCQTAGVNVAALDGVVGSTHLDIVLEADCIGWSVFPVVEGTKVVYWSGMLTDLFDSRKVWEAELEEHSL